MHLARTLCDEQRVTARVNKIGTIVKLPTMCLGVYRRGPKVALFESRFANVRKVATIEEVYFDPELIPDPATYLSSGTNFRSIRQLSLSIAHDSLERLTSPMRWIGHMPHDNQANTYCN